MIKYSVKRGQYKYSCLGCESNKPLEQAHLYGYNLQNITRSLVNAYKKPLKIEGNTIKGLYYLEHNSNELNRNIANHHKIYLKKKSLATKLVLSPSNANERNHSHPFPLLLPFCFDCHRKHCNKYKVKNKEISVLWLIALIKIFYDQSDQDTMISHVESINKIRNIQDDQFRNFVTKDIFEHIPNFSEFKVIQNL